MGRCTIVRSVDVTVVGGGLIGLDVAWRCAQSGASVVVCDPEPGREASWAGAGLLAPVTEAHYGEEALLHLNLSAARSYGAFVAELENVTGIDVGYRRCGTVVIARDQDDHEALSDLYAFQQRLGLDVEKLRSSSCRELEPAVSPQVRSGLLVAGDHQVDNRALVGALLKACELSGVDLVRESAAVESANDEVRGVVTTEGTRITAASVVVAAGSRSRDVEGIPTELRPPVRPVKGQLLHLKDPSGAGLLSHNVRGLEIYMVPRSDGRLVVGATIEERGFETSVTAGAVWQLLEAAQEIVPGVAELELSEIAVGLRPGTPDNAPLIGPLGLAGLHAATGHFRNGILLTDVTGSAIAAALSGAGLPEGFDAFHPLRFSQREVAIR